MKTIRSFYAWAAGLRDRLRRFGYLWTFDAFE